ncbi:DUF1453 domain-containing protein [Methanocella sp. CWC-04]|uniref:DUF1453 domain-containing protein n=1 Tax=Methanooceanicella nereidis TaxID=2052831 RepID=A0AAP2RG19_9EURY|nr:CcdC protein domain-containing protein [Methanocella sp. CWC-04]MCD1295562.1 DUF1453 domain-containing protein [Methanocella sp. CWC-04]
MLLIEYSGIFTNITAGGAQDYQMPSSFILLIVGIVLLLQLRERKLRLQKFILLPLFMIPLTLMVSLNDILGGWLNIIILMFGLAIGSGLGYAISKFMKVRSDDNGNILVKGSLIGTAVWMGILIVKMYGKDLLKGSHLLDTGLLISFFLMVSLGTILVRRYYLYVRYKELKSAGK